LIEIVLLDKEDKGVEEEDVESLERKKGIVLVWGVY
jgi:hypothetical protein